MDLRKFPSALKRRIALEKQLKIKLPHIANFSLDEVVASSRNCENMIGAGQIPIGIAGPLLTKSSKLKAQSYYIPLATTEGALVASVNRGCKAISLSGGASTYSFRVGQTRGPVFAVKSLDEQKKLYQWIKGNEAKLAKASEGTSKHLKLIKVKVRGLSNYVFVRFYFNTGDAMGMNMVTIATQALSELIEKETGIKCLSIAGNYDIDKKPSWLNFINNRGFKVWAEVVLKKEVIGDILKTTAEKFFEVWLAKCMIGSAMSGSLGFNAQYANIIAALFIATGQDPAHVGEGSMGITTAKALKNGDLSVSVYLPSLSIGTVGGGTSLATQREALSILGVLGAGNVEKFAEIIGGAVLAGEISLLSSLSEGSLASAHKRLGRGGK
ncbi:MAG: hydroxymethylglutaryl-CoA reductase, partial [Candidatus Levybacteria bacterium]|nr:hydroxymethylglutaryl-CoA reductase [Candidatus Levybacteria bacterium]